MKSKIYLDKRQRKQATCNREEYFLKYSKNTSRTNSYSLSKGAPLIINIDGIYYYYDKLPVLYSSKDEYENYRRELLLPSNGSKDLIEFIWR